MKTSTSLLSPALVACSSLPPSAPSESSLDSKREREIDGPLASRDLEPVRARELGILFDGTTGPWNAITDVAGVLVGHTTLIEGDGEKAVRTGVTAILPSAVVRPVFASTYRLNGDGELTGSHYIRLEER